MAHSYAIASTAGVVPSETEKVVTRVSIARDRFLEASRAARKAAQEREASRGGR